MKQQLTFKKTERQAGIKPRSGICKYDVYERTEMTDILVSFCIFVYYGTCTAKPKNLNKRNLFLKKDINSLKTRTHFLIQEISFLNDFLKQEIKAMDAVKTACKLMHMVHAVQLAKVISLTRE